MDFNNADAASDGSLSKSELEGALKLAGWLGSDVSSMMASVTADPISRDDFLAACNIASSANPLVSVCSRSAADWAKVQPRLEALLVKNHDENMETMADRNIPHVRGASFVEGQALILSNIHIHV